MKRLIPFILLVLIMVGSSVQSVYSQGTLSKRPAVVFTKADRTQLFLKQPDSAVEVILTALPPFVDSIHNLAILGSTDDGSKMLVAGRFHYLDLSSSTYKNFIGVAMVPINLKSPTDVKFLVAAPQGMTNFRPLGYVVGNEWYAVMTSNSDGSIPLEFYHGSLDADFRTAGTNVDSVTATASVLGGNPLQGGYHMSNLTFDHSTGVLLALVVDGLNSQDASGRISLFRWSLNNYFNTVQFQGAVTGLHHTSNVDSLFGLAIHPVGNGDQVDIGLTNTSSQDNSIEFYRIRYNNVSTITLTQPDHVIPRSAIPSDENFFAGVNFGPYHENVSTASQPGNGGDLNFSQTGDSVVFVTHESPENGNNRNVKSAIYIYDMQAGQTTLVYNDSSAQELQPVFVQAPYLIPEAPHSPGLTLSINSFGTVEIGENAMANVTITDTSKVADTVTAVGITGPNASEFMIMTAPALPFIIAPGATQTVSVQFTPTGTTSGARNAMLNVTFNGGATQGIGLTGTGHYTQPGGVAEDASLAMNLTMQPNPFNTQTTIRLTAVEAGSMGIIVHDALGRIVYTSELRKAVAGSVEAFEFNPSSLGLSNGAYYITGIFGDKQVSKQVVFVK